MRIEARRVTVMNMRLYHGSQQVVRRRYRVNVAGEVEVDVIRRICLRFSSACTASFDPKDRSQRRLSDTYGGSFSDPAQGVAKPDSGNRFAFTCRRWGNGGHYDELSLRAGRQSFQCAQANLGFVFAIQYQLFIEQPQLLRHIANG
ncbi:hypothetical protein HRbin16_00001 [bacterium HR16]|nr:hypothetical protein HRbin16_00001 [bacterium HR16]